MKSFSKRLISWVSISESKSIILINRQQKYSSENGICSLNFILTSLIKKKVQLRKSRKTLIFYFCKITFLCLLQSGLIKYARKYLWFSQVNRFVDFRKINRTHLGLSHSNFCSLLKFGSKWRRFLSKFWEGKRVFSEVNI